METASNFHPRASFFTPATISRGVRCGPEGNFRGSFSPEARILTLVPADVDREHLHDS